MMRKTLSMLLTAVFLTGAAGAMCLGAAAEPWMLSEDFNNSTLTSGSTHFDSWEYRNISANRTEPDGAYSRVQFPGGLYGKPDEDRALQMTLQIPGSLQQGKNGATYNPAFSNYPFVTNTADTGITGLDEKPDSVVHMSAEMAFESPTADQAAALSFRVQAQNPNSQATESSSAVEAIRLCGGSSNQGRVSFFNKDIGITVQQSTWYKFDLLIYPDLGVEGFINGEKMTVDGISANGRFYPEFKSGSTVLTAPLSSITGADCIRMAVSAWTKMSYFPTCRASFDNYSLALLDTPPVISSGAQYSASKLFWNMDNAVGSPAILPYSGIFNMYESDLLTLTFGGGKKGLFGKDPEDTVYEISNNTNAYHASNKNPYITLPAATALTGGETLAEQSTLRLSFDYATKDTTVEKSISMRSNGQNIGSYDVFVVTGNGQINFFGTSKAAWLPLEKDKWYRFDILLKSGTADGSVKNTALLYINGKLAYSKEIPGYGQGGRLDKLDFVRIGYNLWNSAWKVGDGYIDAGLYLDNLRWEYYPPEDAPSLPSSFLTSDNELANRLISHTTGTIMPGAKGVDGTPITVGEWKDSLVFQDLSTVDVFAADGSAADDLAPLTGSIVRYTTAEGEQFFYTAKQQEILDSVDFSGSVSNSSSIYTANGNFNTNITKAYGDKDENRWHNWVGESGLGGRAASDQSLAQVTTNYDKSTHPDKQGTNDPYIGKDLPNGQLWFPYTMEFSTLLRGNDAFYRMQLQYSASSANYRTLFSFDQDHALRVGSQLIGSWEDDRWYRWAFTVYPGTPYIDIYFNGDWVTTMNTKHDEYTSRFTNFFKIYAQYATEGGTQNGLLALDDFLLYSGGYTGDANPSVSSLDDHFILEDSSIYTNQEDWLMNLPNYLDFGNYQAKYFSGGALSPDSELGDLDNFTDGTVIVLTDGPMMAYYTIRAVSPAAVPIIKVDGKSTPRLASGIVTADVFTDLPAGSAAKLLIAAYQDGKLLSVKVTDVAGGFGKTSGIYGTLSQTDGVTVKAFLLQALGNPAPITENAVLN